MEIKKSPKADLQNKRGLLLEIGLIIALGGVIAAFAWTPKEQKIEKLDLNIAPVEEEIMEITRQEQKPPEPPKKTEITVITDILKVVTNDTKITTNVDFAEFEDDVEIVQQVAVEEEEIVEEQPFLVAETMPSFQGGSLNDFRNWVQSKVRYPAIAQENGISGKVVLTFVIEKDGRLTNIQVLRGRRRPMPRPNAGAAGQNNTNTCCPGSPVCGRTSNGSAEARARAAAPANARSKPTAVSYATASRN